MTLLAPTGLEALTPKLPPKPRDLGLNVGGGAQKLRLGGRRANRRLVQILGSWRRLSDAQEDSIIPSTFEATF